MHLFQSALYFDVAWQERYQVPVVCVTGVHNELSSGVKKIIKNVIKICAILKKINKLMMAFNHREMRVKMF